MPLLLVLAFVTVPILELLVIQQVGGWLGLPLTITILLLDSIVGAVLVRREGRRAWSAFRAALGEGRWPGDEVAQGALVLVGGALLLTPGFPHRRARVSRSCSRRPGRCSAGCCEPASPPARSR